jgi:hypothetical protein
MSDQQLIENVALLEAEIVSWRDQLGEALVRENNLRSTLEWYSYQLPMSSGDMARDVLAGKYPEELREWIASKALAEEKK